MGDLYTAEDTRLHRQVALKFLSQEYSADADLKARFLGEARAAAALTHPNIVTIHEIGEFKGRMFIAMELVGGRSLREAIASHELSFPSTVDIFLQICAGLQKAHASGIIHRDIKPANIMVTDDGLVKILDFGLAKNQSNPNLTTPGMVMGTPHYMSPEQCRGIDVDCRSDLFSAGVVLYEMLSGVSPFARTNIPESLHAISYDDPPSLSDYVAGVPKSLQEFVAKLLAKSPENRLQTAKEAAYELELIEVTKVPSQYGRKSGRKKGAGGKKQVLPMRRALLLSGVALSLAIAVVFAGKLLPGFSLPALFGSNSQNVQSLAILCLRNLGSAEDEFLSYGITEDLIVDLSRAGTLRVLPMRTVLRVKDSDDDLTTLAARLGVKMILDGSISKAEGMIHITAQLIDATTNTSLWADRWDCEEKNLATIKQALATGIGSAVGLDSRTQASASIGLADAHDPVAYEYYLRGKYSYKNKTSEADVETAIGLFRKALELEPTMVPARSALGSALVYNGKFDEAEKEYKQGYDDAVRSGHRGQQATILSQLSDVRRYSTRWEEARRDAESAATISQAIGDHEGRALAINRIVYLMTFQSKYDSALGLSDTAMAIYSRMDNRARLANALSRRGWVYTGMGNYDSALVSFASALTLAEQAQDSAAIGEYLNALGITHYCMGKLDTAESVIRRSLSLHQKLGNRYLAATSLNCLHLIYSDRGDLPKALQYVQECVSDLRELKALEDLSVYLCNLAMTQVHLGMVSEGHKSATEAVKIGQEIGQVESIAGGNQVLACCYLTQNQFTKAESLLTTSIALTDSVKMLRPALWLRATLIELYLYADRFQDIAAVSDSGYALAAHLKDRTAILQFSAYKAFSDFVQSQEPLLLDQLRASSDTGHIEQRFWVSAVSRRLLGEALAQYSANPDQIAEGDSILANCLAAAEQRGIVFEGSLIRKAMELKRRD